MMLTAEMMTTEMKESIWQAITHALVSEWRMIGSTWTAIIDFVQRLINCGPCLCDHPEVMAAQADAMKAGVSISVIMAILSALPTILTTGPAVISFVQAIAKLIRDLRG